MNMLLTASDPYISSIRKHKAPKKQKLPAEVIRLLEEGQEEEEEEEED